MESNKTFPLIDFLKDILKHHRKVTAFQKTVALSIFLGVLICIFRNIWIFGIAFSYCVCLYLSMLACRHIVQYRAYLPSELILIMLENIEHFFENFPNPSKTISEKNIDTPSSNADNDAQGLVAKASDAEEFFDASEEIQTDRDSQSIFYVELEKEKKLSYDEDVAKNNLKAHRQSISNYISSNCPLTVHDEINKLIVLIQRDFIKSWYHLFSIHFESLEDADEVLHEILFNVLQRLLRTDIKNIAKILMSMFSNHVKRCKEATMTFRVQAKRRRKSSSKAESGSTSPKSPIIMKSLEECFGAKVEFHTALKSMEKEYLYLNSLVELLVIKLVPEHLNDSKAVVCALREILSCNVLSTVINLVCDPTFLHERIIKITSDEDPETSVENHSPVIHESNHDADENIKSVPPNFTVEQAVKDHCSATVLQDDKTKTEDRLKDRRKSSFLDDTKLHFVPKGMCNECNRLCSKDRDKIEPHPHTCSLGQVQCFLDVKNHDKDGLSASSGEGSPVFKFFLSDTDNMDENSCQVTDHSNTHDIPTNINDSPDLTHDKVYLRNVPLKRGTKDPEQNVRSKSVSNSKVSDKNVSTKPLVEERPAVQNVSAKSVAQDKPHEKMPESTRGSDNVCIPCKDVQSSNASSDSQESKSFLGGNFFNFQFPQFGKKPLSEKNRSSSNLEQVSDTESEDFSNLRRSKSSAEFSTDVIVSGQEALLYPTEAPLPFQEVHIEKSETAKEAGSLNPYTLYVVEYEAIHPTDEGIFVHRSRTVKRRFREFVNLQSRLEDNPLYKKSLKDVKGPRKWLSLPFGNMDKDSIESRRKILVTFLTSLIKKEDICQGSELKEFLGYSGDGHIAFVRKVPENIGPRIDQRLVKTMSGMFDKIVEVLPSLPNELPRMIKQEKSRDDSESDKLIEDCDQIVLEARFDEDPTRCFRLHKALDDFIKFESLTLQHLDHDSDHNTTLGTSVLEWQEAYSHSSSPARSQPSDLNLIKAQTETETQSQAPVPLCNALLDILYELLHGHDSCMCRESVMKSIKTIFGRALERYLNSKIDFLVSAEMDTFYLRTLRETVWPNDELSTESRPNYTDRQKEEIKKQAARCLGAFLPGALHTLLGDEDFDLTIDEIMDSIKCEKLNRHFWYSFLDVLVEHIFPEVKTEEVQRKLSRC